MTGDLRVKLDDYPQLNRLAWNYCGERLVGGAEALAIYERNWRLVDEAELTHDEGVLISQLIERFADASFRAAASFSQQRKLSLYSIGHSNVRFDEFCGRLIEHGITAIADLRSNPYSLYLPQFNREDLAARLKRTGITYVYLGEELGGRPADQSLYRDGKADYIAMAKTEVFKSGIARLANGASKFKLAMMCSERDPLTCHRCLLVGRYLADNGVDITHIERDQVHSQTELEATLIEYLGRKRRGYTPPETIDPRDPEILEMAYARQSAICAREWRDPAGQETSDMANMAPAA